MQTTDMWILPKAFLSWWTNLAEVERLLLGARLDEELVGQSSVLCPVTVAVISDPACLPVSIKRSLQTFM